MFIIFVVKIKAAGIYDYYFQFPVIYENLRLLEIFSKIFGKLRHSVNIAINTSKMATAQMEEMQQEETQSFLSYIDIYNNMQKQILHYPQLDTIQMVERFIRENSGEYKKRSLWESLPKKMMYQTFCVIFDYLQESGKIALDKEGHVAWIWDPDGVKRFLHRKDLQWKSSQK